MRDSTNSRHYSPQADFWIDKVASRALAVVAREKNGKAKAADPELLVLMRSCLLNGDREACHSTLLAMTKSGVSREDVADLYIPELARKLGEEWCRDEISFATVTIGSSKLQALLRELGPEWRSDHRSGPDAPSALVLLEKDENHTLGAQVLAGQLRRKGFSVKVMLSADRDEIEQTTARSRYDVVMISTSRPETIEPVRKLVNLVRAVMPKPTPIVLGGAIEGRGLDIRSLSGADYVTNNVDEALRLCGLEKFIQKDARLTRRR